MRFIYAKFLTSLWDACHANLANISKSSYSNMIKSIGYSKLKTTSTQKILLNEFENCSKICRKKDPLKDIMHIAIWMEAASELRMFNRH